MARTQFDITTGGDSTVHSRGSVRKIQSTSATQTLEEKCRANTTDVSVSLALTNTRQLAQTSKFFRSFFPAETTY